MPVLIQIEYNGRETHASWSGRRDSNPQPSAWEADALPLRHTRSKGEKKIIKPSRAVNLIRVIRVIRG